jgi:hypothetical protein
MLGDGEVTEYQNTVGEGQETEHNIHSLVQEIQEQIVLN